MKDCIDGPLPGSLPDISPMSGIADADINCAISRDELAQAPDRLLAETFAGVPDRTSLLTAKEREVAHLVTQGFSSKAIARKLEIRESTVRTHREHINRKTGTKGAVQLLHWLGT